MTEKYQDNILSEHLDEYRRIEDETDALKLVNDHCYIWERLRQNVFWEIIGEVLEGDNQSAETISETTSLYDRVMKTAPQYTERIKQLTEAAVTKNPYLTSQCDVLFLSGGRRFKQSDGSWWEIYIDPLLTNTGDLNYKILEKAHDIPPGHYKPPKSDNVLYYDLIEKKAKFRMRKYSGDDIIHPSTQKKLVQIESEIAETFDVNVDICNLANEILIKRNVFVNEYQKVLENLSPNIVILAWTDYNLAEACHKESIPTIKLQKGIRHKYHLKYHYPHRFQSKNFSDYKFVWGDYWKNKINYPIDNSKIKSVGYPYLKMRGQQFTDKSNDKRILFLSGKRKSYGEQLSKLALQVIETVPEYEVFYKIHPQDGDNWEQKYPWLSSSDIEVIPHGDQHLYELFNKSQIQIGVCSTALLEGMYFGLNTYVAHIEPYIYLFSDFISDLNIDVFSSVEELKEMISSDNKGAKDVEYLFKNNPVKNMNQEIQKILKKEAYGTV